MGFSVRAFRACPPAHLSASMGEDEAWNASCKEWLIDEGYCYAGGVAGKSDCLFYGAAAMDGMDKLECVFKDPRETNCLRELIDKGVKAKLDGGMWFGGKKYTLVREQELDVEGEDVKVLFGWRPKGGVCIACSHQSVVIAFNDEDKGQDGGNCQKAVLNMVGYLFQNE